jgi:peptidoglycan/xylan/chitin deacetylase (PgdA/CDA1 family)
MNRAGMKAISLAYHDVSDEPPVSLPHVRSSIGLYTLTKRDFHDHLQCIAKRSIAVGKIETSCSWSPANVRVFLTFDDGAENVHSYVADELEKHGWRGHFFVTTAWIGRLGFVNPQQIRELHKRGHVIGSHSNSHPERMSRLTQHELSEEWSKSRAILGDILGEAVKVASVPNGYYSRVVAQSAAAVGIEALFTSEATSTVKVIDGCLVFGRYFIQKHTPASASGAIAAGRIWPRWRQTVLWETKKLIKVVGGESYLTVRRYLISKVLSRQHPA